MKDIHYLCCMKYRIQHRAMSPDVIEMNIGTDKKPKWKVYVAPLGNRNDDIAHTICDILNKQENELNLNC